MPAARFAGRSQLSEGLLVKLRIYEIGCSKERGFSLRGKIQGGTMATYQLPPRFKVPKELQLSLDVNPHIRYEPNKFGRLHRSAMRGMCVARAGQWRVQACHFEEFRFADDEESQPSRLHHLSSRGRQGIPLRGPSRRPAVQGVGYRSG